FSERGGKGLSSGEIAAKLQEECRTKVRGAVVTTFGAPPIEGLGTTGGFKLIIEDRGNLGLGELQKASDKVADDGSHTGGLQDVFNSSRVDTPWTCLDIDRTKCQVLGV